jgi:hypothetical protein
MDGLPRESWVQVDIPVQDCGDGLLQLHQGSRLGKIANGSRPEASLGVELLGMNRMDKDPDVRCQRGDVLDQLQSVFSRQQDLKDHDVRLVVLDQGQRLLGATGLPGDVPLSGFPDVVAQPVSRGGVAVNKGDALPADFRSHLGFMVHRGIRIPLHTQKGIY